MSVKIQAGDIINRFGTNRTVRWVGKLEGCGYDDSVWSVCDSEWDGKMLPQSKGGRLTFVHEDECKFVERANQCRCTDCVTMRMVVNK